MRRNQGAQYVAVPERNREVIVREKYVARTQAGMQREIDQRWMDRDHDRLVNDILAGKVEPPPGFLEKYKIQMPGTDEEY